MANIENSKPDMIDIVGGGIGGLTTAIGLEHRGLPYRIFEQSKELKAVGAGIILGNNAMQVFRHFNLDKQIANIGTEIEAMNITDSKLRVLSKIDLRKYEKKYQLKNIAIHRGKLQELLLNEIQSNVLLLDHKLSSISSDENHAVLHFQNQKSVDSGLTIGADGIYSKVRESINPNDVIRPTNQICWRGVAYCEVSNKYDHELNEAWGYGQRFGFVKIAENTIYWYALLVNVSKEISKTELADNFEEFDPVVREIIDSTEELSIHSSLIEDVKPMSTWFKKRIVLLGDAAHAATPNLGQGAGQAIEDAFVLSHCLYKHDQAEALSQFQKLRKKKVDMVVKVSRQIGQISHVQNKLVSNLRNQVLRFTPSQFNSKRIDQIYTLTKVD